MLHSSATADHGFVAVYSFADKSLPFVIWMSVFRQIRQQPVWSPDVDALRSRTGHLENGCSASSRAVKAEPLVDSAGEAGCKTGFALRSIPGEVVVNGSGSLHPIVAGAAVIFWRGWRPLGLPWLDWMVPPVQRSCQRRESRQNFDAWRSAKWSTSLKRRKTARQSTLKTSRERWTNLDVDRRHV